MPLFTRRYRAWSLMWKSWTALPCFSLSIIIKRLPSAASTKPSISFLRLSAILWYSAARFLARRLEHCFTFSLWDAMKSSEKTTPYGGFGSCCKMLKVGGVELVECLGNGVVVLDNLRTTSYQGVDFIQLFCDVVVILVSYYQIACCWFGEATRTTDVVFTFAWRTLNFLWRTELLRLWSRLRLGCWCWRRLGWRYFFFLLIYFAGYYLFRFLEFLEITWSFGHGVERAVLLSGCVLYKNDCSLLSSRYISCYCGRRRKPRGARYYGR